MSDSFTKKTVAAHTDIGKDRQQLKGARYKRGRVQFSLVRGLGSLVFEGALYLSARSNQGNTVF